MSVVLALSIGEETAGTKQPVHWFLGGKGLGIQQGTSVWLVHPDQEETMCLCMNLYEIL